MTHTFKIKKGEINFENDKVRILDNSKKLNLLKLLISGIWTIYGILLVLRFLKTNDQFLLWTGLFIGITHFVIFILHLFRSNQSEISFEEIKSIKVKRIFRNEFLDLRLKNNKLRRVIGIENSLELEEYINSNFYNTLKGKNITISRSEYTTQNSPFFLNYEYFNIAWGRNHEGYYIDHQGNILKYRKPEKWNYFYNSDKFSSDTFWGYELDGKISSKDLFQNLNNCSIGIVESQLNKINLEEIIQNLTESGYDKTVGGCDMGIRSYSILVYDNLNDQYKRIVLKTYGDISLTNKSVYTSKLLRYFD